jgi:cysteine desulfuration protein SufE
MAKGATKGYSPNKEGFRMTSIENRIDQLILRFSQWKGWEEKYKEIIRMGKEMSPESTFPHDDKYLVKGCQSKVWLLAQLDETGRVQLQADSDALIVKGLVALLLQVYSDSFPEEILSHPPHFFEDLGLAGNLSPSRTNGLHSMVKQIMLYATAFEAMRKSK